MPPDIKTAKEQLAIQVKRYEMLSLLSDAEIDAHIEKWLGGFEEFCGDWFGEREAVVLLEATTRAIQLGMFDEQRVNRLKVKIVRLRPFVDAPDLSDPCWSWLSLQDAGSSQTILVRNLPGSGKSPSSANHLVYLDDGLFTGDTLRRDISKWFNEFQPRNAKLVIVYLFADEVALKSAGNDLKRLFGDEVQFRMFAGLRITDELGLGSSVFSNDVLERGPLRLFPTKQIYDSEHLKSYRRRFGEQRKYHQGLFLPDSTTMNDNLLGGDGHRYVITRAFLEAGAKVLMRTAAPNYRLRPLGYGVTPNLGHGSFAMTSRRCPNTAPLVMWWGGSQNRALRNWHPLLPRMAET